jgi:hypothetical protein
MKNRILILAAVSVCAACSSEPQSNIAVPPVPWRELADGSKAYSTSYSSSGGALDTVVRCWPGTCVKVETYNDYSHKITRFSTPTPSISSPSEKEGFSCRVSLLGGAAYSEHVGIDESTQLASNYVFSRGSRKKPWSKDFVVNLLQENGLPVESYFPCEKIAEVLTQGSGASLATSLVSQGDFAS